MSVIWRSSSINSLHLNPSQWKIVVASERTIGIAIGNNGLFQLMSYRQGPFHGAIKRSVHGHAIDLKYRRPWSDLDMADFVIDGLQSASCLESRCHDCHM